MLGDIWQLVFIHPISVTLLWLNDLTGNLGLAIILLTVIIQLLMTPLRLPSLKSAQKIRRLQPQLKALKEKHKSDKMAHAQAQMELYREHGVNPLGGLLPTLLSIPIIIALYNVLLTTLSSVEGLTTALVWLDLTKPDPFYILPLLVAGAQFWLSQLMTPAAPKPNSSQSGATDPDDMMQTVQTQMKYIFPILSGIITAGLPAGVGLYWLTSVIFAIIQHQTIENGSQNTSTTTN